MHTFTIHNLETAPAKSKPLLEKSLKTTGMIPNLHGVLADSPQLLEGYQVLHELFQKSSLNKQELTVVWQTINVEHGCHYCVPAHSFIANAMKVDPALTEALRTHSKMPNDKLQVLHDTTLAMVRSRGQLTDQQMQSFFAAGYSKQQLLDIVLGLSQKVISNYVNHLAETPLDERFSELRWSKVEIAV